MGKLQSAASSGAPDSFMPFVSGADFVDRDPEATQSENMSSAALDAPIFVKETDPEPPPIQPSNEPNLDGAVANDSESDDNDLYLSECRILLVGFEASEMRKLVNMVRKGGGSRYMSLNDKLTHIVIGAPSETLVYFYIFQKYYGCIPCLCFLTALVFMHWRYQSYDTYYH